MNIRIVLILGIFVQTCIAAAQPKFGDTAIKLQDVTVWSQRGINDKTPSIGKGNIIARDLPQLSQTIDKTILERQQVLKMSDVLQNAAGIYIMGTTGGYQEEIASRGYAFSSNNTFKNGARYNNGVMPELSNVEKLEFLKGGAAILYGNVSPGGLMNIITKKPSFEKGGSIGWRMGSYSFYKPTIDIYGPIGNSKMLAFRINSTYEKGNSFRDSVHHERIYYNPSILVNISSKTIYLIEGDYLKENRTADFGIGVVNYCIPKVSRSHFIGLSWGYNNVAQTTLTQTLTHQIDSNWQIKAVYSIQNYQQNLYAAARASSTNVSSTGNWARGLQKSSIDEQYQIGQLDLTGCMHTGKIKHQLLVGFDLDKYIIQSYAYNTSTFNNNLANVNLKNKNIYDTINIFTLIQKRFDIPFLPIDRITTTPINRYGVYVQDLIQLHPNFKMLLGLRYSFQNNQKATVDTIGKNKGYIIANISKAWSPKIGLVYQPNKKISLFTSYTNSFSPNSGTDINNAPLQASIIDQYELGFKSAWFDDMISANFTLYKIINSNFAQTVFPIPSNNPLAKELAGEVTSDGLEIDIMSKIWHGFSLIAGYSYNDSRYTKSSIYIKNDKLRYNPSNTANGSIYYTFNDASFLKGWNCGMGLYYVGERVAGRNKTILNPSYQLMQVPAYTTLDFSVGYNKEFYSIRAKISNINNTLNYNLHDDNSINPIAPRQFSINFTTRL